MKRWFLLLSHACVVLSLMILTLLVVDRFNPSMDFINNDMSKLFILLLCVFSTLLSLFVLVRDRLSNR